MIMRNMQGKIYSIAVNERKMSRNGKYSLSYLQMTVKCVSFRSYLIPLKVAAALRVLIHPRNQARKIDLRTVDELKGRGTRLNETYFSMLITIRLWIVIMGNTMLTKRTALHVQSVWKTSKQIWTQVSGSETEVERMSEKAKLLTNKLNVFTKRLLSMRLSVFSFQDTKETTKTFPINPTTPTTSIGKTSASFVVSPAGVKV